MRRAAAFGVAPAVALALLCAGPAASAAPLVRATVSPHGAGWRLPSSFMGFSVEYAGAQQFSGIPQTGVNDVFARLAAAITAAGSGPPMLHIGGGSTDNTEWNPGKGPRPPGITYDLDQGWVDSVKALLQRTGMPVILGLNLAQDKPQLAVDWARQASAAFGPAIAAFEVGNEPDVYTRRDYGKDGTGNTVFARPQGWSFGSYLNEFGSFVAALHAALPSAPLAGPGACCDQAFLNANDFLHALGHQVALLTYHWYPLNSCGVAPGQPGYPSLDNLLRDKALIGEALSLQQVAAVARRYATGVRLTETNSVACGGRDQVSNTMGSALWGVDWLFTLWAVGVRGADFHVGDNTSASYSPLSLGYDTSFAATARPLYYGMLLFARATAHRARLLPAVTQRARIRRGANVKVWGTLDGRTARVVVLDKDASAGGTVVIRARGGRASLERLTAPSLQARAGVRLAGQSVPDVSRDGRLTGAVAIAHVPNRNGAYRFALPPAGAALLTIPRVVG